MAYDSEIEIRINKIIKNWERTSSKKMFGGVCFLKRGNMVCGIIKDYLILRLGIEKAEEVLSLPHVEPFDLTGGSPMKGWVMVKKDGFKNDDKLEEWLVLARDFVDTLPPKE